MKYKGKDHTFAVCAYKESTFLEACLLSLLNQSIKSNIILVTSTPNEYISDMAAKYDIMLYAREGTPNIAKDWNFAYVKSKTKLVTITHQDDIYEPLYLENVLMHIDDRVNPLIAFCDYAELRENDKVYKNALLRVKKLMLLPLKMRKLQNSIFIRRRILSMGSPICCPSVTFVKPNLPETIFKEGYRSDVDWQAWEMISRIQGAFVYISESLMCHRIHEESETTRIIADNDRTSEDLEMFKCFWPDWAAKIIIKFYRLSQKSNDNK